MKPSGMIFFQVIYSMPINCLGEPAASPALTSAAPTTAELTIRWGVCLALLVAAAFLRLVNPGARVCTDRRRYFYPAVTSLAEASRNAPKAPNVVSQAREHVGSSAARTAVELQYLEQTSFR